MGVGSSASGTLDSDEWISNMQICADKKLLLNLIYDVTHLFWNAA